MLSKLTISLLIVITLIVLPKANASEINSITGIADITDGDTIKINGEKFRFVGIDTPETHQKCCIGGRVWACGKAATEKLRELIADRPVKCTYKKKDRYGRWLAERCTAGDTDLYSELVLSGMAFVYKYKRKGKFVFPNKTYLPHEKDAQINMRGIWGSEFVHPYEWRKKKRVSCESK